jgi:hypothetical protein
VARKKGTGVDVRDTSIEDRWKQISLNGSSDDGNNFTGIADPASCQMHSAPGEINSEPTTRRPFSLRDT